MNVCDGSYFRTKIYPVSGLPEEDEEDAIGNFYVAPGMGKPVAYDLPGGALTMVFRVNNLTPVPDGQGGTFLVGTLELDITEATGFISLLSVVITRWWIYCIGWLMALSLNTASASSGAHSSLPQSSATHSEG